MNLTELKIERQKLRDEISRKIDELCFAIRRDVTAEYAGKLTAMDAAIRKLEDEEAEQKVRDAQAEWLPPGTRVKFLDSEGNSKTGIVEIWTGRSVLPPSVKYPPKPGEIIIRHVKKDGTPAMGFTIAGPYTRQTAVVLW